MAEAWPNLFTLVNILSGFRKCGIFLINPGAVSDRQLIPSRALRAGRESEEPTSPPFTPEQDALYERRFQEGYDIPYAAWLKINHPLSVTLLSHRRRVPAGQLHVYLHPVAPPGV